MPDRLKVLLAETDAAAAGAMVTGLRTRGIEAVVANDAVHAVSLARQEKPDALLMSARLAGGAVAAIKRLRSNVYTTHIPVIGLAPAGVAATQLTAAGAAKCFAAPIDFAQLEQAIRAHEPQDLDFTHAPAEEIADPARLADLQASGLLDSGAEESFDRLTRLAARLLDAPTALVTLVDKDRQFFKSQVGLAQPWAGERQTRLSHSFCQWVVAGKDKLVVADANEHPALRKNLAIRDLGVIAYAGVPIAGRQGHAIGSFCAIDSRPREWSAEELETLDDLGKISQAYALLDQAQRHEANVRRLARSASLHTSAAVAGNAILGAARILRRRGARIDDASREDLLAIVEEQAAHLAAAT